MAGDWGGGGGAPNKVRGGEWRIRLAPKMLESKKGLHL